MQKTFSEAIAHLKPRPFQWLVAILAFMVLMFDGIDMQSLALVSPQIFEEWGIERGDFGSAMAAALFGMGFGAAFGGWLGDRFGRLNMLFVAALTFGIATIGAAYTTDVMMMTIVRLLGGIGFGAAFPNSMALANDWMPPRLKSYTVATLSLGVPAGTMISGVAVPMILGFTGWQGVFVGFGVASVVLAFVILFFLKDSPPYMLTKGRKDKAQSHARLALGDDNEIDLISEPEQGGGEMGEGETIGVFHTSNKRMNIGIGIGFAASTAVVYGLMSWSPSFLTSRGFTLAQAQQVSISIGALSMIGGFSAGFLANRFGSKRVIALASISTCVLLLLLTYLVETIVGVPSAVVRFSVTGLIGLITGATSVGIATIYVMMAQGYPQSCRGGGIGFGMLMGRVGGILMAFYGGTLLDIGGGSFLPYFAALLLGGIMMFAASAIVDRHVEPVKQGQ